ncbi:hypothetical protein GJ744_010809 [Endocarpon pusillum]|uniref:Uncharacterized protein n=1 Tax=Endocarpon pusillum TaxID=364733 RepID=A0A8H7E598_9EURO|nr:hypothetical protein GJ744_010809 [Endocarpon pusillum]
MATNCPSTFYGTTTRTLTTNCPGLTSRYPAAATLVTTTKSSTSNAYPSASSTKKEKDKDEKEKEGKDVKND